MGTIFQNFRFALRLLRKSPGFTIVAMLTLALGIGANTAIFSVVYATLLAPMPYPNPDQLVMVWSKINGNNNGVSAGDFLDWKNQNKLFQNMIAWTGGSFSLSTGGHPGQIRARIVSPGSFDMVGEPLKLGRDFLPEEGQVGRDHVVVMTHTRRVERFGSDPTIIGQNSRMNGEPYT